MKTYHVFIASSLSFQKERDLMEKVLTERNNSELNIVVHRHEKNGDNDIAKGDTQEIINSEIRQCDVIIFFAGIFAAYYIAKLPRLIKGVLDVVLTLPLVLPPTVVGYLLLRVLGPKRVIGAWVLETFGVKLVMTWWSAIFATTVVIFPLMYRTVRGAFEAFDETLAYSGQTLGLSNTYIFWRIRMPCCRQGVLAGTVLAFARALGEYGATSMIAGYTPGKTATIATTVYQLWRTNDEAGAMRWVLVDIVISAVVLLAVNLLEKKQKAGGRA